MKRSRPDAVWILSLLFVFCEDLFQSAGRKPAASRYSPDMSKHILFGSDKRLRQDNLEYGRRNY